VADCGYPFVNNWDEIATLQDKKFIQNLLFIPGNSVNMDIMLGSSGNPKP